MITISSPVNISPMVIMLPLLLIIILSIGLGFFDKQTEDEYWKYKTYRFILAIIFLVCIYFGITENFEKEEVSPYGLVSLFIATILSPLAPLKWFTVFIEKKLHL